MGKLRSNRVKRTPQLGITSDRYQFLGLEQAEPNLGDPLVGPSSVGVNSIKAGTFYQLAAIGQYPGERFWSQPVGIGTSFGVISVYANNTLPNSAFQKIHGLNFVGAGVTLETPPLELFDGIGIATVRFTITDISNAGQVGQVLYNSPSGYAYGAEGLYYVSGNVGVASTQPKQALDVVGNGNFTGIVTAAEFRGFIDGSNISNVTSATTSTNVIGGIASVTSLNVSGISTLGIVSASNALFTGIVTAAKFVGVIDGPINANAATATTAFNVVGGIGNLTTLSVSGITSLGIVTTGNIFSTGIITATDFYGTFNGSFTGNAATATTAFNVVGGIASVSSLSVSGVSTLGFITSTDAFFTGVVTATNFYGTFNGNLNGNASTATTSTNVIGGIASVSSLNVSGVSTLGFITSTDAFFTGIVTATQFVGNLIGDVEGNISTATTAVNVVGGIGSISSLSVSGVSTLANVSAGNTTGTLGQYLSATGAGVTWSSFPQIRTGFSTIASIGQTSITTTYNVNYLDVYVNGVRLPESEYTAVNGSNIDINIPFFGGENIDILSYNIVSTGAGDTSIQWLSSPNNSGIYRLSNVGIGTTASNSKLTVEGSVLATQGFISNEGDTPIKISVVGNQLIFTAVGIGSTTLTLI